MKTSRSSPTAFRFDPEVKAALSVIADKDGRSMANMLEWLIRKHCEREGLGWPPEGVDASASVPQAAAKSTTKSASPTTQASKNSKSGNRQA